MKINFGVYGTIKRVHQEYSRGGQTAFDKQMREANARVSKWASSRLKK